jgi:hypothetical protein
MGFADALIDLGIPYDTEAAIRFAGDVTGHVLTPIASSGLCPDCRSALEFAEGATLCRACGFSTAA